MSLFFINIYNTVELNELDMELVSLIESGIKKTLDNNLIVDSDLESKLREFVSKYMSEL